MNLSRRVAPKISESLVGFLMRAADANHLSTVAVLKAVLGRVSHPPDIIEAEKLAEFCRCSVPEIIQLFGFQVRCEDRSRCWKLGSEWITKANFISSRLTAVCCDCLRKDPYIPGTWELSLYRTCAVHRTRLLSTCPACGGRLRWNRPSVCTCGCGLDFRSTRCESGSDSSWVLAQLIEHRLDPYFKLNVPETLSIQIINRLAALSLDGLFKTVWFLGHCLGSAEDCKVGHGRAKPTNFQAEKMIEKTFQFLVRWPESLHAPLEAIATHSNNRNSYRRMFGPLVLYLEQELGNDEFLFIRLAYERQIRDIWRRLGARKFLQPFNQQMEFEFADTAR